MPMRHWGMTHAVEGDRGAVSGPALVVIAAAAGGLLVGGFLGSSGTIDLVGERSVVASAASAPYVACPGDADAGVLHRGDRVFATARDQSGTWIQVRSPRSSESRVWIRSAHLVSDADLATLPVLPCRIEVGVIVAAVTTTTTSVATTTGTTVATTTGTTLPGPAVGPVSAGTNPIWESYDDEATCLSNPARPSRTVVTASASAPAGMSGVVLHWQVGAFTGSVAMAPSGGSYQATLGPFDAIDPNAVPQNETAPLVLTVRATDATGRTASSQITITLNDCTFS